MKLVVSEPSPVEKPVIVRLEQVDDGVNVIIGGYNVVKFYNDGTMRRPRYVGTEDGLQVEATTGRIKMLDN